MILVLLFTTYCFGQDKEKLYSLNASNNGLFSHKIDDFYAHNIVGTNPYWYNDMEFRIKLDLAFDFQLNDKLFLKNKLSYGTRHDTYNNEPYNTSGFTNGKVKQNFYELEIGLQRRFTEGDFQVLSGFGLMFTKISDREDLNIFNDQSIYTWIVTSQKGGYATGVSNITTLRYLIGERVFLTTNIRMAVLYLSIGGEIRGETHFKDSNMDPIFVKGISQHYRNFELTRPDFSFGAGFKF